jgi:hypothetical protein
MKPRRYARGIQFSLAGLTFLSAADSSLCSDAASADASASASFGTEPGVASAVDAASAAGAGAGISSAILAFGHARSASRKLPNANALTTINKARFMIFHLRVFESEILFRNSGLTSRLEQGTDQAENADSLRRTIGAPGRIATLAKEVLHAIRTDARTFSIPTNLGRGKSRPMQG